MDRIFTEHTRTRMQQRGIRAAALARLLDDGRTVGHRTRRIPRS